MKNLAVLLVGLGCAAAVSTSHAIDLKQSKVTQVVNDVKIISAADQKTKSATVNDIFAMPDILRTGESSRAELVAQDETVTRVGANTIFSFDPANRTIDLKQGSLLFHSPHGKGGGTIHTGSATASVLGTTLIVTTTPNGGMKVLDLEGEVEVKFLSGLKQKLDPGQMTFILPGGNQLAPVIIFRLDTLIQNSLLVKGFNQTLDSLPLIQKQITTQIKQIQSGKITDTGLNVGNDASPNQVEVLDPNTVNQQNITPSLADAKAADATLNQSSLNAPSVPTPPFHVFTSMPFSIPENNYLGLQTFEGFVAHDIAMNTPAAGLDPLIVDFSPYAGLPAFSIVAVNNLSLEGSVTFSGLSSQDDLTLIAGNQLLISPGIALRADVNNFLLSASASLTLDGTSLYNFANNIKLNSGGDVVFKNSAIVYANGELAVNADYNISSVGSHFIANNAQFMPLSGGVSFDSTTLDSSGFALFIAPSDINLNNSTINANFALLDVFGNGTIYVNNTTINVPGGLTAFVYLAGDINVTGSTLTSDAGSGSVKLASNSGSVSITGTSIATHYLTVNSGDGILLDASGKTLFASGAGATAAFSAPNLITVNNSDFSSFSVVNMAANTIALNNVSFGADSSVMLRSLLGLLNVEQASGQAVPGYVNFYNVKYGNDPAQNHVNNGGGITVTTLH